MVARRGLRVALFAVILTSGLNVCSAQGASVAVKEIGCSARFGCSEQVFYDAAPGERNGLTVTQSGLTLVFRDSGAAINPGRLCAAAPGGVSCRLDGVVAAVSLGDGDDRFDAIPG